MPTVAIASEFLTAFARIPQAQQKRVREFTEKFQSNPTSPSINYEKIHGMRDPEGSHRPGQSLLPGHCAPSRAR